MTVLLVTIALAGCGGETAEHGGGEAEHAESTPGATTPHVEDEGGHGEIGGSHGEATRGPGASDRHDLKLALDPSSLRAGREGELAFRINGPDGEPITKFEVEHTKQIHLIVVSQDLEHFVHVHPKVSGDGTWRTALKAPAPGDYRVIDDVQHEGRKLALTGDLKVGGGPVATGRSAPDARFVEQKLTAGEVATLKFEAPGRTEPYLGAAGHLVVMREGDLEYLHVHPQDDELAFSTSFPKAGRYVMFLEYKRAGEVLLSRFPVTVSG
jgi:hypothetical protein